MTSRLFVFCMFLAAAVGGATLASAFAYAQGGPVDAANDATTAASSATDSAPPPPIVAPPPPADTASSSPSQRGPRGPAVRERQGRRSRGASTASGALMLTILIGALAYYVIKRLRR